MERLHYSILDPMSIPVDYFDLNLEMLRMDHERDEVRARFFTRNYVLM
jgi:hypothetical protein